MTGARANANVPHERTSMTHLSSRHVEAEEATRLGVKSGWYGTKVSGTFVTGPHATDEDCLRKIKTLGPVPDRQI
jgi:hypothetical protein